jgi:acyl dehydratase
MSTGPGPDTAGIDYFEDFRVGQRFTSGSRLVTEADLVSFTELSGDTHPLHTDRAHAAGSRFAGPVLQGPFGLAVSFGLFNDLGLATGSIVGLLDTNWRYLRPIYVGDTLRLDMTITGCRRTSGGDEGVVSRDMVLINQHDETVQRGSTAVLVRARERGGDPVHLAFATIPWGQALARRLEAHERFRSATGSWDGTVGLRCGAREVQFRIYRSRIIEVTRRTPLGATFTVGACDLTWTELLTGDRNDFLQRAMRGQFEVTGNGYEYLRLTKVLSLIVDQARGLAEEGAPA